MIGRSKKSAIAKSKIQEGSSGFEKLSATNLIQVLGGQGDTTPPPPPPHQAIGMTSSGGNKG